MLSEVFVKYGYFLAWSLIYVVYAVYLLGVLNGTKVQQGTQVQSYIQRLYGAATINTIIALVIVVLTLVNGFLRVPFILIAISLFLTFVMGTVTLLYMRSIGSISKIVVGKPIKLLREGDKNPLLNKQNRLFKQFYLAVGVIGLIYVLFAIDGIRGLSWSILLLPSTAPIYVYLLWELAKILFLIGMNAIPYFLVRKSAKIYNQYKQEIGWVEEV